MKSFTTIAVLAIILGSTAISLAQPNEQGAVELSDGTKVPQNPSLPKLNLTNVQREQIRRSVLTEHNEVEFRLNATKSAKDFVPVVGQTLPKGVKANSLRPAAVGLGLHGDPHDPAASRRRTGQPQAVLAN